MSNAARRLLVFGLGGLAAAALSCGGDDPLPAPQDRTGLTRVSGPTPFASGCEGAPQDGTHFRGAEVEPSLAVDPTDPAHLVAAWQQDRWSNGGASGIVSAVSRDGGRTWARSVAPLSRCGGGTPSNGGDSERASDPWVAIAADGTAYEASLSFDRTSPAAAILVSRSTDGGATWGSPTTLERDDDPDVTVDKGSITADPTDARLVYAVWDRLTGLSRNPPVGTGPTWFARTLDGGGHWQPAKQIYDPGFDAQTIGNVIVVLPGGALVNLLVVITNASSRTPTERIAVMRSDDQGGNWGSPIVVADLIDPGVVDGTTALRTGALPSIAVDRASGALYVAWADARFGNGVRDAIVLSTSPDGGASWSPPAIVNGVPAAAAFTPVVAVAGGGRIGVLYADLRDDDPQRTLAHAWLATSADGGTTWHDAPLGGPFDLRGAPDAGGLFLGDYQGLVAQGDGFAAAVAIANTGDAGDPTDIYAATF
ncbi:MAG: sialidase family protein [Anaeromyxobacteraceae bacterium]